MNRKTEKFTTLLRSDHWLSVHRRLRRKICFQLLDFSVSFKSEMLLSDYIHVYTSVKDLWQSSDTRFLTLSQLNVKFHYQRSYTHQSSAIWNELPLWVSAQSQEIIQESSLWRSCLSSKYYCDTATLAISFNWIL